MSDFALSNYLEAHDPEPVECPECQGAGEYETNEALGQPAFMWKSHPCPACDGQGVIEP